MVVLSVIVGVQAAKGNALCISGGEGENFCRETAACPDRFYSTLSTSQIAIADTGKLMYPADISVYTDLNSCDALITSGLSIDDPENIITSLTWQMEGATEGRSPLSGVNQLSSYVFNEGTTVVSYFITDLQGRVSAYTFEVVVTDNQSPRFVFSPGNITVSNDPNDCAAQVSWSEPVPRDNCVAEDQLIVESNYSPGDIFPVGTTEVVYRVSDGHNEMEHRFDVTVIDDEQPYVLAPNPKVIVCGEEVEDAFTSWKQFEQAGGKASDNCEIDYSSFRYVSQKSSDIRCPYTITRTYSIADMAGNMALVERLIEVTGEESQIDEEQADVSEPSLKSGAGITLASVTLVQITDVSCYGGSDGAIDLDTSSSNGPITSIKWDDGPTTLDRTGLSAGTYTIRVTDGDGETSHNYTVDQPAQLAANVSSTDITCSGATDGTITVSSPSGGYGTYQVSINGTNWYSVSTASSYTFSNLSVSNYTVEIRDAGHTGCSKTLGTVNISQPDILDASVSKTDITCNGEADGTITVSGSSGGYGSYQYRINSGSWQSSGSFSGLSPGSYSVQIRDASNQSCIETLGTVSISQPDILDASVSKTDVTCNGAKDGTITVSGASGGYGSYQYRINSGSWQSSGSFSSLSPGSYSVQIRDASNQSCIETLGTVNITQPDVLDASVSKTNVTCNGAADGTIIVSGASGGYGSYQYRINSGSWQSSGSFSGLSPGSYSVQIRDASNQSCIETLETVTISQPDVLDASVSKTNVTCNGAADGTITVSGASGGYGSYQYRINSGSWQSSGSFSSLSPGSYSVQIRDASNQSCIETLETVTISQPDVLDASVSKTDVTCNGADDGTITVSGASGGYGNYQYRINSGSWQSSGSFSSLSSGSYSVQIRDASNQSCIETLGTEIINEPDALTANANITDPILCYGETATIQISASGGTSPYTYYFEGESSNSSGIFGAISGTVAGTNYDWSVTDANGCYFEGSITVSQPEELVASASAPDVVCNGQTTTVTITASGGTEPLSYTLNGVTKSNGTFTGITAGTYSWSVKDANNCTPSGASGTITINEPDPVTITTKEVTSPITCNGGTATVTIEAAGGSGSYYYTFNGETNTSGIFTGVYAGSDLSISVEDDNGCGPAFESIDVEDMAVLDATLTTSPMLCNGGSPSGEITVSAPSGGSGSYEVSLDGSSWFDVSTTSSYTFTGLATGNYFVQIRDKATTSCVETLPSVTITEPTVLKASVDVGDIACYGETSTVQITASGGTPGTPAYHYFIDGVEDTDGDGVFQLSGSESGTSYSWKVTDANDCEVTGTISVTQPAELTITSVTVDDDEICENEDIALHASASGGTAPLQYNWTGPDGFSRTSTQNPVRTNAGTTAEGWYEVTVVDANNCSTTASVYVTVHPTPTMSGTPQSQSVCDSSFTTEIIFSGADSYTWINSETSIGLAASGTGNIPSFVAVNETDEPLTASIEVTPIANGCEGEPEVFTITVNPEVELTITNNVPIICMDGYWWWGTYYSFSSADVNIVLNSNVSGTTFYWDYADGTAGSGNTISETIESTHTYTIYAEANGCYSDTLTTTVTVIDEDVELEVNVRGSYETEFCPGEEFSIDFYGGEDGYWYEYVGRDEINYYYWETQFIYTVSNPNVAVVTSDGPFEDGSYSDPVNISFEVLNTTDEVQTAVVTITPWAYVSSTYCEWRGGRNGYWDCDDWSDWEQLCAGEPYEIEITVQPFAIVCPSDIVTTTDVDDCYAERSPGTPVTSCPSNANLSWNLINEEGTTDSGSGVLSNYQFAPGITTVTYTAEDDGEYRTCSFDVTVTDEQAPTINCPSSDVTLEAIAGECGAYYDFSFIQADDNCTVDQFIQTEGPASASLFPPGTTTLAFYAEDESGNSTECSFDVVVVDNIAPSISCVEDQTVCAESGMDYTHIGTDWEAAVSDNCSGVSVDYTLDGVSVGTTLNNIDFSVAGSPHTVVATATDAYGNFASCSFEVQVDEKPAITLDPVGESACLNGSATLTVAASGTPAPTLQWRKDGVEISGETGTSLNIDPLQASDAGTYDVVATNSCGSVTSAAAVLSVTSEPVITTQPASQTDCDGNLIEFDVVVSQGSEPYSYYWEMRESESDAWGEAALVDNIDFSADSSQLKVYNIGNSDNPDQAQYRVTVTDACGNTAVSSIATLTANNVESAEISLETICQGEGTTITAITSGATPLSYQWLFDDGSGWVDLADDAIYSGATSATLTINNATVAASGEYRFKAVFPINKPNNISATECTRTLETTKAVELTVDPGPEIIATATPSVICPGENVEIRIYDDYGASGVTYSWTRTNETVLTGSFTESMDADTLVLSGTLNSGSPNTLLTTTFNITGSTVNDCESTAQLDVTVGDETVPTVFCQDITVQLDATGNATIAEDAVDYGSYDDCGSLSFDTDITSFDCSNLGDNPVVLTVTDANGNSATCSATVTVEDNIKPTAICTDISIQLDAAGVATITAADLDNGSSDNCGSPNLSIDISSFDCTDLGANNVKLVATDAAGNKDSCTAVVTVLDEDYPVDITATVTQLDTLCEDDATDVEISITGGVGTIEYIFNGVTNNTGEFTVPAGYSYAWSVTNSLGCGTTSGTYFVETYQPAETPEFTAGADELCQDADNEIYTATAANSVSIAYSVSPASAGTINSATGEMDWDAAFSGEATITATATGHCNTTTADLTVNVTPTVGTPSEITVASGTEPSCQLTNGTTTTTYATSATDNTGFNWSLSDNTAGTIDAATGVMTWADGFSGTVDIQVTANGCNGPSAMVKRTVTITPTVGTPSIPSPADSVICQGSGTTTFYTSATDATDYTWSVTGAGNTISGTGTSATVSWDPDFSGTATVSVSANGCNGPSAEVSTDVTVLPTPIVTLSGDTSVCQNTSPDPEITVTNPQDLPVTLTYNLNGGASQTIDIAANSSVTFSQPTTDINTFVYTMESVQYQNEPACSNTLSESATITIRPKAPVAVTLISGSSFVLPAATETYTIDPVDNATYYNWTVPSGWTIVSGQGTTSISVITGIAGEDGDISVVAQNDCGDSPETDLVVTISSNLAIVLDPQDQSDCYGNTVLFSVSISGGAEPIVYTWEMLRPSESSWIPASGESGISFPSDGEMLVSNIGDTSNPDGTQYRVTVSDASGSNLLSSVATLTVNDVLSMSPVEETTTICEGESTSFSATTGGETPVAVVWEKDGVAVADDAVISGAATTTITFTNARPSDAGEYRLSATFPMTQPNDDAGNPDNCVYTSTIYRTLVVNPLPELAGPSEMCIGQTASWTPNTGGTWVSSDPAIASISDAGEVEALAEGTVTFTFTIAATGCSQTSDPVIIHPVPLATAGGSATICFDGSVTVSGASAENGTVFWTHDGMGTLSDSTTLTPTYTAGTGDADATVTLILNVSGDSVCTPQTDTAAYLVHVLPEAQVEQPDSQEICSGTSTDMINFSTVNTTGTTSYTWTNTTPDIGLAASGSGSIIAPFTGTNPGTEPLVATIEVTPHITSDGVTCDGPSKTFTITVNPIPEVEAPVGLIYCNGVLSDSVMLSGTPEGVVYDISGGESIGLSDMNGVTAIPPFVPAEGTATLTVIPRYAGCSGLPVSFEVEVRPTPMVSISGGETVCQNSAPPGITFSNYMDLAVVVTYSIISSDGDSTTNSINILDRTATSVSVPTNEAGIFVYQLESVQYLDSDPPVCANDTISGTATIEVIALPVPTISGATDICADSTEYVYTTESGMSDYTWVVSAGGEITSGGTDTDNTVTVMWTTGGVHNVSVRYNNANDCAAASPTIYTVTVFSLPEPTITGSASACLNETVTYSTQPGNSNYEWEISAGGTVTSGGGADDNTVSITWTGDGPQTVSVNYTSDNGCTAFSPSEKEITVYPLPEPELTGPDTVCAGTSGNVYTTDAGMSTYVWTVSAGGTVTAGGGANSNTATITWNTDGLQTVSVTYIDPTTSCEPEVATEYEVYVYPKPVPAISGPDEACVDDSGNTYTTEAGMSNYTWTVSSGGTIDAGGGVGDDFVSVTWTSSGTQTVSVNYENSNGCTATAATEYEVSVHALPTPMIAGETEACLGTTLSYSTVAGMSNYVWGIPAGASLVSGGGTDDHEVTITWNSTGDFTISLNYTNGNGCNAAAPVDYAVTVYDLPEPTITGPVDACNGGGAENVYETEAGMTAYVWTVSGGNIVAGGSATDSTATVVWNTSGTQTISVNYYNANNCKAETAVVYEVNVLDPNPPDCPNDMNVCTDDSPITLSGYSGESPSGGIYAGTGVSFDGSNYSFDPATAGPGVYTITYTLDNICSDQCEFTITVTETPVGSASDAVVCSGYPVDVALSSTVDGTTFSWTSSVVSGSVTGNTNCSGGCGTMISDTLTNLNVVDPGESGTNAVVEYTVTATNGGCSSTFVVEVQVRPEIETYYLTWNSNFVEDFIEVCAGAEALSDNDIEVLDGNNNLVGYSDIPSSWDATFLYGPSPSGPWTEAPGNSNYTSYYQWEVDFSVNNSLGYHYFVLRITDPTTGCVKYSEPAILNVVSSLIVEAGDPIYLCGGSTVELEGAYVGGISSSTVRGAWSITSPSNTGSLSSTSATTDPASVTYTPPSDYVGEITLTLTTDNATSSCDDIQDTRTVTVVPQGSFEGCTELSAWTEEATNSDGYVDDSQESCLLTLVGSDNQTGSSGIIDITHCTGEGTVVFDWTFLAPANEIVWHQEDQKEAEGSSSVDAPDNIESGDLIIVTVHTNSTSTVSSSGFTLIESTSLSQNGVAVTLASFYKIAGYSEPTSYSFSGVGADTRILAARVTGHDPSDPIGNSSENTEYFGSQYGENGYREITVSGVTASSDAMLVAVLAVDVKEDDYNWNVDELEFSNSPLGMTTVYYNDEVTASRVATDIVSGSTGSKSFQWPSYNSRNRNDMAAAAQLFTINEETDEEDAAYYLLDGTPTLLSKTNGATGTKSVSVNSGDEFGFRVSTKNNTGGAGELIIYNLEIPNDIPVLTGLDSVFVEECQNEDYEPEFEEPVASDDCGTPVIQTDYPVTGEVEVDGCLHKQTRTWVFVDDCGEESLPFEQTVVWSVFEPIILECPEDPVLEACTDEDIVIASYNDWVDGFAASGGCDLFTNKYAVPPLDPDNIACGDTLIFTFTATDACGRDTSCTSTFTVLPVDTLIVTVPSDTVLAACTDYDDIVASYDAWKAAFGYDGGCAAVTDNMDDFPELPADPSCGVLLEFTYMVSNECGQFESRYSTFAVDAPEGIVVTAPAGVSLPLCSTVGEIEAAYETWKNDFSYTGGCNTISNIDSFPALGDLSCGGDLSFTYRVRNANEACEDLQSASSTFSVAEAPDLILSCPPDTTIAGCLGIQEITNAYDAWADGFRATGGCEITTNIDEIPPLGDMVCNGSITFTFVVGNDSTLCSAKDSCTSTFTIGAAPELSVVTPPDTAVTGCNTDQEVIDAFNSWRARFSYTGGCEGYVSASDLSVYDLPTSCGGTVSVVYSAWDNCDQLVTDSASFTINAEPITISAPMDDVQDACQTQEEIDLAFDNWKSKFGFSGGCGTVGTDLSEIVAPDACGGTVTVNYSAYDVCGQVVNESAIFTINLPSTVEQKPSFTVPDDIIIYRNDTCGYDADTLITGVPGEITDNCTSDNNLVMSHSDSIVAGSCASEILIYRKWTVIDNCANETSQIQLITVTDTTPPTVFCAADVNGVADNGECDATGVDIGNSSASDNCAVASFVGVRSDGLLVTDPYPVGITTIEWIATDACGNTASCTQTVTMVDGVTQPPVIICPDDVVQNASENNCYLEDVSIDDPTATDNCEVASISWEMSGATTGASPTTGFNYVGGETFNVGVTTVTYTAADSAGNTGTCSFTVTIKDITIPEITANCEDVSDEAAENMCSKVSAKLSDPVYSDNCWPNDSLTVVWEMSGATTGSGNGFVTDSSFNVGVTTVTYTVSDPDGNEAQCDFTVTILDVTPPEIDIISCYDVEDEAAPDNCSKVPAELPIPDYSDACWDYDSLSISYTVSGATTASGDGLIDDLAFNVGVSTVTYTVTDPDGNSDDCSFTVTIVDVTDPVIEMEDCVDVSDVAAADSCSKIPGTIVDPDYSDTCWPKDSLQLSYEITGATTGSGLGSVIGTSFNVGVSYVTYTVTDPDGNYDECTFAVTIVDVTPPNIDIDGCVDVSDTTDMDECEVIPANIQDPVYDDDCWPVDSLVLTWTMTGATTGSGTGSVSSETFNTGITTVTYTVSDPDGNEATCDFTVTILPFDMPAFVSDCPPDVSADNDPGVCGANLTIPVPTVDDPCSLGYTISNSITGTNNASGDYPVDTTYVVWTITPSIGDADSCIQMVIVRDVEAPEITTCPANQDVVGCDSTAASLSPAFSSTLAETDYATFSDATNQGAATDNCGIVRVTYIDEAAGTCPMVITRTWTVYDAAGNSDQCQQTITIGETEPPVIECPPDLETPSDFDSVFAMFTIDPFPYSDNCTDSADIAVSWTITGTTVGSGTGLIPTPYRFNRGLSTVEYTFVDACGNESTCSFTVYVHYPPDITCPEPLTLCNDDGYCYNYIDQGDADNPGVPTDTTGEALDWTWIVYAPDGTTVLGTGTSTGITPDPVGGVEFPVGTSTIHWYAENLSGYDECDQLLTIEDCESPTFTAEPWEDCVESLTMAVYNGDADNLIYEPDYPDADYALFEYGDTSLDIDLSTFSDNCCLSTDSLSIRWRIDFDGDEPSIEGSGQPSEFTYTDTGLPGTEIYLWGDGVNFQSRMHTITYWITDCNGVESEPVSTTITVTPRPELIKVTD